MTDIPSNSSPSAADAELAPIDALCRVPLLVLFGGAALWLILASAFGLIASIKFHSPDFLADAAWLTYGRVRPAAAALLLYGFALPTGLGVALWIFARKGRAGAARPWLIALGGKLWHLGVLVGVLGILAGDSTGFENLEMPRYAAVMLFLGYLLIGVGTVLTLHRRRERLLQPSQWFLLAALFWWPWIYSTAHLLLTVFPVRGMSQAVIAWWYSANLNFVWLWLVGLAAIFHFLPRLTGRPLYGRYVALFTFWTLILFAGWSGVPDSAPVPAWLPALSTIATVLTIVPVLAVAVCVYGGGFRFPNSGNSSAPFIWFGLIAWLVSGGIRVVAALPPVSPYIRFTWFTVAQAQLNTYGFFVMTLFGALYYIIPRVTGMEWPSPRLVRVHYWLAAWGIVLSVVPLAFGGVLQGMEMNDPQAAFVSLSRTTLPFLRASTLGELLVAIGHLLLLVNLVGLSLRYVRAHFMPLYAAATAELNSAEVKP